MAHMVTIVNVVRLLQSGAKKAKQQSSITEHATSEKINNTTPTEMDMTTDMYMFEVANRTGAKVMARCTKT